jgi:hypothetical protein
VPDVKAAALLGGALALLACGDGRNAALNCQQRLVDVLDTVPPRADPAGLGAGLASLQQRLDAVPRDGCSDDQSARADALARSAGRAAALMRRIGDPLRAMERSPGPEVDRDLRALMAEMEGFETRRQALRQELLRMTEEDR